MDMQISTKKMFDIYMLGPVGDKIEQFKLKVHLLTSANFNDLDWASNDPSESHFNIVLRLRYIRILILNYF
jgi:hypothetical protein